MNNWLMYLGGMLVVILAALFAVPSFIDWNGYRGVFEEEASRVLGRDVRVGGAVNLRLLPSPYVRFEKVRLADTTGQTGEPFVRAENFTMRLAVSPMLRGELEANEIELNKPVLTLALDGQGGGNWSSILIKSGALPFVPQNVALRSVRIIDGAIGVYAPGAKPVARIQGINGELAAESLKGPFKYKGVAEWAGEKHDVKFATSTPAADGSIQIKATSRTGESTSTFALDGKIEDAAGKPKLSGDLTAKLPVPNASATLKDKSPDEQLVMDFKSRILADAGGASFEEIAMSLDNAAEPQLISGSAKSVWGDAGRFDIALVSKWLDLDRLSGSGHDSATFESIKGLALGLMKAVAGDGAANAQFDIEQVKFGGETTGGLKIDAQRGANGLTIKNLHMGVPGGARLHLSGDIRDDGGKASFTGTAFVHGSSLSRLVTWAAKSGTAIDVRADGPFSAGGKLKFDESVFDLSDAAGEVSGKPLSGSLRMDGADTQKISVTLEAETFDTHELFPATAEALEAELRRAMGLGDREPAPAASTIARNGRDITARIVANELKHGERTFKNVDATLAFERDEFRVPSARLATANGLQLGIEGHVKSSGSDPKGRLAYDLVAPTATAIKDVAMLPGLGAVLSKNQLDSIGPGKIAGLLRLGERSKTSADVSMNGALGPARLAGTIEFDDGLGAWKSGYSRWHLIANGADLAALMTVAGAQGAGKINLLSRPADAVVTLAGSLTKGAAANIDLRSGKMDLAYSGQIDWPDARSLNTAGKVTITSAEMSEVLALAGIDSPAGVSGIPVAGHVVVSRRDGIYQFNAEKIAAGESQIRGSAALKPNTNSDTSIEADLVVDHLPAGSLLQAIVDHRVEAGLTGTDPDTNIPAPVSPQWPNSPFAVEKLQGVKGTINLAFGSLSLGDRLNVHNGSVRIGLEPGKITATDFKGTAGGGDLDGNFAIEKVAGGTALTSRFEMTGFELSALSRSAKGRASVRVEFDGRGSSPAALAGSLAGKGNVDFKDAVFPGPSPRTAAVIVGAVLQNQVKNDVAAISTAFSGALNAAAVDAGSRSIPVTISNGVAKIEPQTIDTGKDKLAVIGQADLSTLSVTSAWLITPVMPPLASQTDVIEGWAPPPDKGPLPPISVTFNGRLDRLQELEPSIDVTEMQRELTVRQMERNVSELERIRKLDEQRARQEQERRKAIEAEKAAAAAAARALRDAPPPPQPQSAVPGQGGQGAPPPNSRSEPVPNPGAVQNSTPNPAPRPWSANPQPIEPQAVPPSTPDFPATIGETGEQGKEASDAASASGTATAGTPPPVKIDGTVSLDPANEGGNPQLPVEVRPVTVPKARPKPKRTTADEIYRSLGGIP